MSKSDLIKDILRLKLRIGEEIIGILPEDIQGPASEKRREILEAVRDICTEFLTKPESENQQKPDLKPVTID